MQSSFEPIKAEMEKNFEGDEYLDYSDIALERRQNFRAVSFKRFACLNGRVPTVDEEFDCWQEPDSREARYAVAVCVDTQSGMHACTVFGHFPRQISHVSFMFIEHNSTMRGRETGILSRLAHNRTELFRLMNFRALRRKLEKPEICHN